MNRIHVGTLIRMDCYCRMIENHRPMEVLILAASERRQPTIWLHLSLIEFNIKIRDSLRCWNGLFHWKLVDLKPPVFSYLLRNFTLFLFHSKFAFWIFNWFHSISISFSTFSSCIGCASGKWCARSTFPWLDRILLSIEPIFCCRHKNGSIQLHKFEWSHWSPLVRDTENDSATSLLIYFSILPFREWRR